MDDKSANTAAVVATVIVTLLSLYVGSYLLLVRPGGHVTMTRADLPARLHYYAAGSDLAAALYWPLERLDRRLRPDAWLDAGGVTHPPLD